MAVKAPAELDASSAPAFRDDLAFLLSQGALALEIDMHEVEFIDSSGMGALVAARKLAVERGGSLLLRGAIPRVAASLRVAGLTDFLGVEASSG